MATSVNIYFGAFCDEDVTKRVFNYIDERGKRDEEILENAFELFNAPEEFIDPGEVKIAKRYRKNGLRSLSVGDVVEVDNIKYICEGVGWRKLKRGELERGPKSHHRYCPHK